MTTPQEQRVKAGPMLGSRLEFFKVTSTKSLAPGQLSTVELIAAAKTVHDAHADTLGGTKASSGVDFNEVQKDTASQARLDYFVAAINMFAQPIMLTVAEDGMSINFAFEHVGAATAEKIEEQLVAAILNADDVTGADAAAKLAAAQAMVTVTKQ